MARSRSSFKMGVAEMLILRLLMEKDMYGYELTMTIKERSEGRIEIVESSLYPVLYKLLDKGLISDREEIVGRRRIRVYYHLEEPGKDRFQEIRQEYDDVLEGVRMIFDN